MASAFSVGMMMLIRGSESNTGGMGEFWWKMRTNSNPQ